jgi:hypothetical protein
VDWPQSRSSPRVQLRRGAVRRLATSSTERQWARTQARAHRTRAAAARTLNVPQLPRRAACWSALPVAHGEHVTVFGRPPSDGGLPVSPLLNRGGVARHNLVTTSLRLRLRLPVPRAALSVRT